MTAHCAHCQGGIAPGEPLMVEYRNWDGESRIELVGPHELPSGVGVVGAYHVECHDLRLAALADRVGGLEGDVTGRCAVCLEELRTDEAIVVSYHLPDGGGARTSEVIGPFDQPRDPGRIEAAFHMPCWGTRMHDPV